MVSAFSMVDAIHRATTACMERLLLQCINIMLEAPRRFSRRHKVNEPSHREA
jgi:hypothetical protein